MKDQLKLNYHALLYSSPPNPYLPFSLWWTAYYCLNLHWWFRILQPDLHSKQPWP